MDVVKWIEKIGESVVFVQPQRQPELLKVTLLARYGERECVVVKSCNTFGVILGTEGCNKFESFSSAQKTKERFKLITPHCSSSRSHAINQS